jgi:hypothetical protein
VFFFSFSANSQWEVLDDASVVHWTRLGLTRGNFGALVVAATKEV